MGFPGAMKCQSMALSRQEAAMALQVNAFGVAGNLPHSSAIVQQVWTATLDDLSLVGGHGIRQSQPGSAPKTAFGKPGRLSFV